MHFFILSMCMCMYLHTFITRCVSIHSSKFSIWVDKILLQPHTSTTFALFYLGDSLYFCIQDVYYIMFFFFFTEAFQFVTKTINNIFDICQNIGNIPIVCSCRSFAVVVPRLRRYIQIIIIIICTPISCQYFWLLLMIKNIDVFFFKSNKLFPTQVDITRYILNR